MLAGSVLAWRGAASEPDWERIVVAEESSVISVNRQAYHDYFVDETFEAGVSLVGTEVKSIRAGHVNLRGAYARVKDGEIWLEGMNIAHYEQGLVHHDDPLPVWLTSRAAPGEDRTGQHTL